MINIVKTRIPTLDGLRGLICIAVLLGHTQFRDGQIVLPAAVIMMDIFFSLSGLLIGSILLEEIEKNGCVPYKKFWLNRIFRTFPTFYLYYFIGVTVYLITRFEPILGDNPTLTMTSVGLLWSNWATAFGHKLGIYTITWSLSTEEQFYFIVPIFFGLLVRKGGLKGTATILIGLIILVIIHRVHVFESTLLSWGAKAAWERCYMSIDTRVDSLLMGCLSAVLTRLYPNLVPRRPILGYIGLTVILAVLCLRDIPVARGISENSSHLIFMMYGGFNLIALMALFIILDLAQNQNSLLSRMFSFSLFVKIGLMSYSIYLWHTTVFGGIDILLKNFNDSEILWFVKCVIRYSILWGVTLLSYNYVEKPFHQLGKRLIRKNKG